MTMKNPFASSLTYAHPGAPVREPVNPRMGQLLAEIDRTGTLSPQSLSLVKRDPKRFSPDELRELITAIGTASLRGAFSSPIAMGGALVHSPRAF
ncbi:MAG: hypothetical protein AVDCRST_MAG77-534 [uncultured Chloroflexi bacterium]|uniref:Uncharacterized protein n=1 Tax=uncultured Chloroflexota bacterium TaxID=166587 RepID=A0A6J4HB17_9CHLR|nr:MAG: hypothetical protein AVDCRST_MAG77-534 [uncultured Chloroflexota bacterium]